MRLSEELQTIDDFLVERAHFRTGFDVHRPHLGPQTSLHVAHLGPEAPLHVGHLGPEAPLHGFHFASDGRKFRLRLLPELQNLLREVVDPSGKLFECSHAFLEAF
jgi:hypothetical protein